jgi:hypothetical protein
MVSRPIHCKLFGLFDLRRAHLRGELISLL